MDGSRGSLRGVPENQVVKAALKAYLSGVVHRYAVAQANQNTTQNRTAAIDAARLAEATARQLTADAEAQASIDTTEAFKRVV